MSTKSPCPPWGQHLYKEDGYFWGAGTEMGTAWRARWQLSVLLSGDTATGDHLAWQERRGPSEAESTARGWQPMMRVPCWDPSLGFETGSELPKGKRVPPP